MAAVFKPLQTGGNSRRCQLGRVGLSFLHQVVHAACDNVRGRKVFHLFLRGKEDRDIAVLSLFKAPVIEKAIIFCCFTAPIEFSAVEMIVVIVRRKVAKHLCLRLEALIIAVSLHDGSQEISTCALSAEDDVVRVAAPGRNLFGQHAEQCFDFFDRCRIRMLRSKNIVHVNNQRVEFYRKTAAEEDVSFTVIQRPSSSMNIHHCRKPVTGCIFLFYKIYMRAAERSFHIELFGGCDII